MNRYRAVVYGGEKLALDPNRRCWYFRVYDSEGRLMALDDTGDWRTIFDHAHNLARTLRELEVRGFDIKQPEWLEEES